MAKRVLLAGDEEAAVNYDEIARVITNVRLKRERRDGDDPEWDAEFARCLEQVRGFARGYYETGRD